MNPFAFFGRLFAGTGARVGSGIGLWVIEPAARLALGLDPGATIQAVAGEVIQRAAYGFMGGGALFKLVKGEIPLPWTRAVAGKPEASPAKGGAS